MATKEKPASLSDTRRDDGIAVSTGPVTKIGKMWGREVVHSRSPSNILPPLELTGRKLNIGAGWDRTEGFFRLDIAGEPDAWADVRHLPIADDSVVEIRAFHVLEHIERRDLVGVMNECWRVLEVGGVMEIEVPTFPSDASMADPTHVSFFVAMTFDYFAKGSQFEGERILYGIKPWDLTDRVRDAMAMFLRVRLKKLADDDETPSLGKLYVTAGTGPEGTGQAPAAEETSQADFHPCCGAPANGGHLGTCDRSTMTTAQTDRDKLFAEDRGSDAS